MLSWPWAVGHGVCLWSGFLLFSMRYARHLIAIWCRNFIRLFVLFLEMLRFLNCVFGLSWMALLTPTIMVMRGFSYLPFFVSLSISVLHLESETK